MKNILLAVTGLSPQVVTEIMFALHQNKRNLDAVHVITTMEGRERIYSELLCGEKGYYYRYLREYGIDPSSIDFGHQNIHVINNGHGLEIQDIVREEDNEFLLRKCLDLAFYLTSDPETTVFFSVAGGRKTMSSCLSLAAQMYGRPRDRMYHVLVSPEFESNRQFYYPPKKPMTIKLMDSQGQPFYKNTKYAEINLVHIPFISIREKLAPELLKEPQDPGTLMLSLIKDDERRLTVNLLSRKLVYKPLELDLMPARMALYAFFAMQKKNCTRDSDTCGNCTECFLDIRGIYEKREEILDLYRKVCGTRQVEEMSNTGVTGLNAENFNMYKGKIKAELLRRFGPYALRDLEIASEGTRPNTRYGIRMDKSKIEIVY